MADNEKYPVCCCCAEDNQRYYFDRILFWAGQFASEPYSFHVFCDGNIVEDPRVIVNTGVNLYVQQKLGRTTSNIFQGYKRNFLNMCRMFPNGFAVCENDVLLLNKDKFRQYTSAPGLYCGYSNKYHFIETAIMVLNDPAAIKKFADHYSSPGAIYENEEFENTLSKLSDNSFKTVFIGERKEMDASYNVSNDYVAQFF